MAFLLFDDGKQQELDLDRKPVTIGRNPANQVVIRDDSVSRDHARIRKDGAAILLEDLRSRNGTSLNGIRIQTPVALKDSDTIEICGRRIVFRSEDASSSWGRSGEEAGSETALDSIQLKPDDSALSSIMAQIDAPCKISETSISSNQKLRALIEITKVFSSTIQLSETLDRILNCLFDLFVKADRGFVVLENANGEPEPQAMKLRVRPPDKRITISRTIVDHVMQTGKALLSSDVTGDANLPEGESIEYLNIRSIICAPLMNAERKPIGLIQLDTARREVAFREEDLELLVAAAAQAGLVIENARLVEETLAAVKLKQDLEAARQVQMSLLPLDRPRIEGYDFYDYYQPANHVGGDYFDYVPLESGNLAIIIADVVGHGIGAALLMSKLSSETRVALKTEPSLAAAIHKLNNSFSEIPLDKFVTMAIGVLDPYQHRLRLVNAGHMQPLIRHHNGTLTVPVENATSIPIGIFEDTDFPEVEVVLAPGDVVFLYTDGLNESANEKNEEFGTERVEVQLSGSLHSDPAMIAGSIINDLKEFVGKAEPFDDICVVAFGREDARDPRRSTGEMPAQPNL